MSLDVFLPYLVTMAVVTYLIRMIPLVLVKNKIKNKFILSFLYYVPYAVLSVMTVPAIFYATDNVASAIAGFVVALILAFFDRSLLTVALGASGGVLIAELIMQYVIK